MGKFTPQPPRGGFFLKSLIQLCLIITIFFFVTGPTILSQPVKIGLLIQDSSYTAAFRGAGMAVRFANENGGLKGRPFSIVVRSMEGPWGTGSKKAVELIFNEKVCALMASCDGRNAHIVEQAATKATVVMLSAWSGDPTLSQAFVPWFFNCAPNYNQQAEALSEEIYENRKYNKIAVISDDDYDSDLSLKALLQITRVKGKTIPEHFSCENYLNDSGNLADQVLSRGFSCIILFCNPVNSHAILKAIRKNNAVIPLFGSLTILNEDLLSKDELNEIENSLLVPSLSDPVINNKGFAGEYFKTYGTHPGIVASFSYDMANVLINALLQAGSPDREKIQEALEKISIKGITGPISFDDKGNREGKAFIF